MELERVHPAVSLTLLATLASVAVPLAGQTGISGEGTPAGTVHESARHHFQVVTVAEGLDHPWSIAWLPNGDMLVTERPGRLRIVRDGKLLTEPVAGVPSVRARGQGGLLEVLPHPDFATNRTLYLSFAKPNEDESLATTAVVRGRLEGDRLVDVNEIFEANPLLFDLVLKRRLRVLEDGLAHRFRPIVFESRRVFPG